jgi:hypothetical protein
MFGEGSLPLSTAKRLMAPWAVILGAACRHAPPPAPPPPPPPPLVVVAPPPAPKCEKAEEGCVSRAETRARIGTVGWDFAPPEGWTYAQGDEVTTASMKSASLGVAAHDVANVKNEKALREEVLRRVADRLGVTLPRKRELIKRRPDKREKMGALEVDLYQLDGGARDGKKGPLLVFAAKIGEGKVLLGLGFVADDDKDNADTAIMKAIGSISSRNAGSAPPKASP